MGNSRSCMLNVGKKDSHGNKYSNDMHICNYYNDKILQMEIDILNNKLITKEIISKNKTIITDIDINLFKKKYNTITKSN